MVDHDVHTIEENIGNLSIENHDSTELLFTKPESSTGEVISNASISDLSISITNENVSTAKLNECQEEINEHKYFLEDSSVISFKKRETSKSWSEDDQTEFAWDEELRWETDSNASKKLGNEQHDFPAEQKFGRTQNSEITPTSQETIDDINRTFKKFSKSKKEKEESSPTSKQDYQCSPAKIQNQQPKESVTHQKSTEIEKISQKDPLRKNRMRPAQSTHFQNYHFSTNHAKNDNYSTNDMQHNFLSNHQNPINFETTSKNHHPTGDNSKPLNSQHQNGGDEPSSNDFDHPVYKRISLANGMINRMKREKLLEVLDSVGLSKSGSKEILQKRLKTYCKKQHLLESNVQEEPKKVFHIDYYVVIDVEATCEEVNPPGYQHEIIELPAILIKTSTWEIVSEFSAFCRPVINPNLTDFCRNLTTIKQIQVDASPLFADVFKKFDEWLKTQVKPTETFAMATDGPWDIDRFIKMQCQQSGLQIPHYFHRWVNVRKHFQNFYKLHNVSVEVMLQHLGMEFVGTPHRGIDDSRNISRILKQLHLDGADLFINESFR